MRQHNFDRIVGNNSPTEIARANEYFTDLRAEDIPNWLFECGAEMTREHQLIIQDIQSYIPKFLEKLGIERPLPTLKILLLDPRKLDEKKVPYSKGTYWPKPGTVTIVDYKDLTVFAETFAHEYIHTLGYTSAHMNDDKDLAPQIYRQGWSMNATEDNTDNNEDENTRYFKDIDEAVVTELSYKILSETNFTNPVIGESLRQMAILKAWFESSKEIPEILGGVYADAKEDIDNFYTLPDLDKILPFLSDPTLSDKDKLEHLMDLHRDSGDSLGIYGLPYAEERKMLSGLITKICQKTDRTYIDIFNEFAKTHFSGNYLSTARLIKKTLGTGSFRDLAEKTSEKTGHD